MRLGVVLDLEEIDVAAVPELAVRIQDAGLEMLWLRSGHGAMSSLAAAASCAAVASGLLVGAEVGVDDTHPLFLAEERNVVDQLLGGRLVLGLRAGGRVDLAEEWLQVLLAAGRGEPLRHTGTHFTIPAGLPQNRINPEQRVRVTPAPFSLEPQTWLLHAPTLAGRYGISPMATADLSSNRAHQDWERLADRLGPLGARLRRPGARVWDPTTMDATELAEDLVAERELWGLDTVVAELVPEPGSPRWLTALAGLSGVVRPRVQNHSLPWGLEQHWDDVRMQPKTNEREVTT